MAEKEAAPTSAAPSPEERETPIVATWTRTLVYAALATVVFTAIVNAYVVLARGGRTLASLAWVIGVFFVSTGAILASILRAEETRLARELRTARTGTALLRNLVVRRSQQAPILGRLFSTQLGTAAVHLADGDRGAAMGALASTSPLLQGGRIDRLRAVVDADVERASGTASGRAHAIASLRAAGRLGHREADLYRVHVLAKAILEHGDADAAVAVASELEEARNDEERLYAAWLRVWFDLDSGGAGPDGDGGLEHDDHVWPPLDEGQARLATLVARAQGAERLVHKLEERLLAIAQPEQRE